MAPQMVRSRSDTFSARPALLTPHPSTLVSLRIEPQERSKDFRENLRQIPISWRSSLSRIVSCLEGDSGDGSTKNEKCVLDEKMDEEDDDDDHYGELQGGRGAGGDIRGIVKAGVSRKRKVRARRHKLFAL